MRNEKGITLVALVITIIVLIILAGISINTLIGENGIIKKAKEAKQNIQIAEMEEREQLNQLYEQLEDYELGSIPETGIIEDLKKKIEELENKFGKLQSEFNEFRKVIADAITEKGVPTQSSDSAQKMAENIKQLGGSKKFSIPGFGGSATKDGIHHSGYFDVDTTEFKQLSIDIAAGYNSAFIRVSGQKSPSDSFVTLVQSESGHYDLSIESYSVIRIAFDFTPAGGWGGATAQNILFT